MTLKEKLENQITELSEKCENIRGRILKEKNLDIDTVCDLLLYKTEYLIDRFDVLRGTDGKSLNLVITFEDNKTMYLDLSVSEVKHLG